jgi:hypothetical protein
MMHALLQEPSKGVDAARSSFMSSKRSIEALTVQPDFLAGGQLRDYQLDGINWLTYAWIKVGAAALAAVTLLQSSVIGMPPVFEGGVIPFHAGCCYGASSCFTCMLLLGGARPYRLPLVVPVCLHLFYPWTCDRHMPAGAQRHPC